MAVLEIFDRCPGDISWCPRYIFWVSWRYFMVVLEIFGGCAGDI